MSLNIKADGQAITFSVHVQPRASANQLAGLYGDTLKIKLTSPPVEGAANKALVEFMAGYLGLAKSRIQVLKGEHSRQKLLRIEEMTVEQFMEKISEGSEGNYKTS